MVLLHKTSLKCIDINFLYQNVRGLRTKTAEVLNNVLKQDVDVVLLTETWLNDSVFDHELFDRRYIIFRRDRGSTSSSKSEGGGVLIAVLKKLEPVRKQKWESGNEDLWVVIKLKQGGSTISLCICTLYFPPPVTYSRLDSLVSNITNVIQHKLPQKSILLLAGDFNLPQLEWQLDLDSNCLLPASGSSSNTDSILIDALSFNGLCQLNQVSNANGRTLDLIITNSPNYFSVTNSLAPLVNVDGHHPALNVLLKVNAYKPPKINKSTALNFSKADYSKIKEELENLIWSDYFNSDQTVDETVDTFYSLITPIITNNTPLSRKGGNSYPFWFSRSLIKTLKEKAKFHCRYKKYSNPMDFLTYRMLRDRCDKMMLDCLSYIKTEAKNQIRKDPKYFWTFIKSMRCNSSEIPDEMFFNSLNVQGGQKISDLFSEYFHSTYLARRSTNPTGLVDPVVCHRSIGSCKLSTSDILKSLLALDTNKGPGPDLIPPVFLKTCSSQLVEPLHLIFNKSLSSGVFPTKWKLAHITPVHKKGDLSNVANYRPISILSAIGKLFESMVQKTIHYHLKPLFDPCQHGFLPGRSTTSNLFGYVGDISGAVEDKFEVHAIYTDFSKAFDVVDHSLLIQKLGHAGICGSLLRWCESYLQNRSQLVMVRGFKSAAQVVPSGVPQGSHLGPLFFLAFINDLCASVTSKYQMFADDLKLYKVIREHNDTVSLQNDINAVTDWCSRNRMVLNAAKCYHIKFTRKRHPTQAFYHINGSLITEVTNIRDLGVTLDSKLDFRDHIDLIAKKGARLAGFVTRQTKFFKDIEIPVILFNCYVRSLLEYCSPIWSPSYAVHVDRLERLQKQFLYHLSFVNNLCHSLTTYDSRLAYFKLTSLEFRRSVADILFLHKIINGKIDSPELLEKVELIVPRSCSRLHNRKTFNLPSCRTNYAQHSPLYRMCSAYNAICHDVDIFGDSINTFKKYFFRNFHNNY